MNSKHYLAKTKQPPNVPGIVVANCDNRTWFETKGGRLHPVDTVSLALQSGATYVGRSFSGDKKQLVPLIKGAIAHQRAAFIDIVSPCIAFDNHEGSNKSYDYVREHNESVNLLDFWPTRDAIGAAASRYHV